MDEPESQVCTACGVGKPLDQYDRESTERGSYVKRQCRDCINAKRRARYAADPKRLRKYDPEVGRRYRERHRDRTLDAQRRSKYGLAPGEYERRAAEQDGRCAVCQQTPDDALQVDHCHDTGAVRGLLCGPCNRALGLLKDDPDRALRAAEYLTHDRARAP